MPNIPMIALATIASSILLSGCSGPLWQFPGGALSGPEQAFDASMIEADGGVIQLETSPQDPYSVNVGYVTIKGNMYLDPASGRTWFQNMRENPLVRIRFSGSDSIYPAVAVAETDPAVVAQFAADRHILRIDPRTD